MLNDAEQKPFFQEHGCRLTAKHITDPTGCAEMKGFAVQRILQAGNADVFGVRSQRNQRKQVAGIALKLMRFSSLHQSDFLHAVQNSNPASGKFRCGQQQDIGDAHVPSGAQGAQQHNIACAQTSGGVQGQFHVGVVFAFRVTGNQDSGPGDSIDFFRGQRIHIPDKGMGAQFQFQAVAQAAINGNDDIVGVNDGVKATDNAIGDYDSTHKALPYRFRIYSISLRLVM